MNYQRLKSIIIIATVLVWLRFLVGAVQFFTNPNPEAWADNVVATEQEKGEFFLYQF